MYLYPHKDEWQAEFKIEKNALISDYQGDIDIHHIGSTAIAGLYAKDCIDLLGVVKDISQVSLYKDSIIKHGYTYKGEYGISGREYFSKQYRKFHLHIFQAGDFNVKKHLNFVRIMRNNVELISELNQLKQKLHAMHPQDKEAYQNEKKIFYNRINKALY